MISAWHWEQYRIVLTEELHIMKRTLYEHPENNAQLQARIETLEWALSWLRETEKMTPPAIDPIYTQ